MAAIIPELTIYKALEGMLAVVKIDHEQSSKKEDTFLWNVFGEDQETGERLILGNMDYYKEAKEILLRGHNSPREISIHMGYNLEKVAKPSIHILLPSEQPKGAPIGQNEGYEEQIVEQGKGVAFEVLTSASSVVYNLMITSDNSAEVIIIYQFLKAMFLAWQEQFELRGFQNVVWGGSDIQFTEDMVPPHIQHRNFTIGFTYDYSAKSLSSTPTLRNFFINSGIIQP